MPSSCIKIVIPDVLMRSRRPGWPSRDIDVTVVNACIKEAKNRDVQTIICLLDDEQLAYYAQLGEQKLLAAFHAAGFNLIHHAVRDHRSPVIPPKICKRIASDFLVAELPLLVHCSAGIERTNEVVNYLVEKPSLAAFRDHVYTIMREHNQKRGCEHFIQVTRLAVRLYDELEPRHGLAPRHQSILWAASMLHDTGTAVSGPPPKHTWRSGILILNLQKQLRCRTNLIRTEEVATIAALHGLDGVTADDPLGTIHPSVSQKWPESGIPDELQILAGILRVADGLDRSLTQNVRRVSVDKERILVKSDRDIYREISRAREKGELLCATLDRRYRIEQQY